jgi:type VI secretion system secreted protein Hcp
MAIYLNWDNGGIAGDATESGFEHWINLTRFSWGPAVDRTIRTETGRARNREHAQPHIKDITIEKEFDHSTGRLLKELCSVPKAKDAKIAFVRTNPDGGDPATYLQYTLSDALLSGVRITNAEAAGHGANRPTETWTLNFTQIAIEVKQLDEANNAGAAFHFKYNLATGKEG